MSKTLTSESKMKIAYVLLIIALIASALIFSSFALVNDHEPTSNDEVFRDHIVTEYHEGVKFYILIDNYGQPVDFIKAN